MAKRFKTTARTARRSMAECWPSINTARGSVSSNIKCGNEIKGNQNNSIMGESFCLS